MAEYIERQALINQLSASCIPIDDHEISGLLGCSESIRDIINAMPATDVRPERHGRWVVGEFNGVGTPIWCGRCGYRVSNLRDPKSWIAHPGSQYCGCCGAKMDGKETI